MTNLAVGLMVLVAGLVILVALAISGYTGPILLIVAVLFGLPVLGMLARRVIR